MIIIMILIDGFFDNFLSNRDVARSARYPSPLETEPENLHIFFGDDIERLRE